MDPRKFTERKGTHNFLLIVAALHYFINSDNKNYSYKQMLPYNNNNSINVIIPEREYSKCMSDMLIIPLNHTEHFFFISSKNNYPLLILIKYWVRAYSWLINGYSEVACQPCAVIWYSSACFNLPHKIYGFKRFFIICTICWYYLQDFKCFPINNVSSTNTLFLDQRKLTHPVNETCFIRHLVYVS